MDIAMRFALLFPHEREALLEALRRDVRTEQRKIKTDPEDAHIHLANSRIGIQILEALNPKKGEALGGEISSRCACSFLLRSSKN